jgi:hypothetical protein
MTRKLRYRIFFELFLLSQSNDSLEILKFLREPLIPSSDKWKWTYWSRGKETTIIREELSNLIADISGTKFNHAWFSRKQSLFRVSEITGEKELFYANYFPSPTCVFWDVTSEYRLRNGNSEDIRRVYQHKEALLRTNGVDIQPSLLMFDILIQSNLAPDVLLNRMIPVIVDCFNGITINTPFIGGIDIQKYNPKVYAYCDGITKLEFWPFTYPMIGKWFDRLRPINIASKFLCNGIKKILSVPDIYYAPMPTSISDDMAIVQIPLSVFEDEYQIEKLNRFVVPCDASTERVVFRQERGEFATESGEPIFTLRRYRQKFPSPPNIQEGFALFPILPSKYCKMLNIDMEDMAVFVMEKKWRELFEKELDRCFAQLSNIENLHEKIWKMYLMAIKNTNSNVCYLELLQGFIVKSKFIH